MSTSTLRIYVNRITKGKIRIGIKSDGFDPATNLGYPVYKYNTIQMLADMEGVILDSVEEPETGYNSSIPMSINSGLTLSPTQLKQVVRIYNLNFGFSQDATYEIVYK